MVSATTAALVFLWASPDFLLDTNRSVYHVGDTVTFTLQNAWNAPVHMANTAPWAIERWTRDGWQVVESHWVLNMIVTLAPGDARAWTWTALTQTDQSGLASVGPGWYRISTGVWYDCSAGFESCSTLDLAASFSLV